MSRRRRLGRDKHVARLRARYATGPRVRTAASLLRDELGAGTLRAKARPVVGPSQHTLFLLSPANCSGPRAALLTRPGAKSGVATALRSPEGAPIAAVFTFLSSLYFRGKLAYAHRFGAPAPHPGLLVIAPGLGLCREEQRIGLREFAVLAQTDVAAANPAFAAPLRRAAEALVAELPSAARVVLLGSIATPKYVEPLLAALGERLLFPSHFVGRGDMSRGGLLLRCAREGSELSYEPVQTAVRHGRRATRIAALRLDRG